MSALIVGCIVSVLIGWGLVLWGPLYESRRWLNTYDVPRQLPVAVPVDWWDVCKPSKWEYFESLGPGVTYGQCFMTGVPVTPPAPRPPPAPAPTPAAGSVETDTVFDFSGDDLPGDDTNSSIPPTPTGRRGSYGPGPVISSGPLIYGIDGKLFFWRAGFPIEAVQCTFTEDPGSISETPRRGSVAAPKFLYPRKHATTSYYTATGRYLPCDPLWAGLALDSVIWGTVWFILRHGPRAVRRHWRRGEGRCVECGYERAGLKSSTCPECGDKTDSQTIAAEAVRVRRRTRNAGTAALLLILAIWAASLRWGLSWTMGNGMTSAWIARGALVWRSVIAAGEWRKPGFERGRVEGWECLWKPRAVWDLWDKWAILPLWTIAVVAALPAGWGWRASIRAWRRKRHSQCTACGYDRRGIEGHCPECGAGA
jgi:hypothetical protein